MRRILAWLLILAVGAAAAYLLGPRVAVDTTVTFDPASIGGDPEAYLARAEDAVAEVKPEARKEIVWADPAARTRTPLAVVYIHGFSATKGEVRPLPDLVAKALGANLYYTRLTGHGRDGPAMAEGSVNAWVNDYAEAMAVGRRIGDRLVVIATSTGGSLASWAATRPALSKDVAAFVLISPNYGVQAAGAGLLTMPWGRRIAEFIVGKERGFEPINDLQARLWTTRYPTSATLPMAALTELAWAAPVEKATAPALFVFSDADKVVRPARTRAIADRWGARHEIVPVETSGDPSNHVIAGEALSPATTRTLAERIIAWVGAVAG